MKSSATTVAAYLAELPPERQKDVKAVRAVIRKNLPKGFAEQMQYGMIGYVVPHKLYPAGYHCNPKEPLPLACLGSQKNHITLHLMTVYGLPKMAEWLKAEFAARGKKLDMGKGCLRFKKVEDLPLDVIGEAIARVPVDEYIRFCESSVKSRKASAVRS